MSETTVHGPGSEVALVSPARSLIATIRSDEFMGQVKMALPADVTPERFQRATVTALMQNEEIARAEPDSIYRSVIRCAQDGLLPDGREAAIMTFRNNKKGTVEAQYIPMIGGLRKIAGEQGWTIRTQVVYANDEFAVAMGLEPQIVHIPVRPGVERGPLVAAYAVGAHGDGRREVEVMDADDIAKVRASSRASQVGPWKDWEERMWEKTVGRRLFKKLPLGERDAERVSRVIEASKIEEPEDAAAALYGPEARLALNPVTGEILETSEAEPVPPGSPVGATSATAPESASEQLAGERGEPGPSEGAVHDQDVAATAQAASPAETPEPVIPVEAKPVDARLLAQARKAKPPMGSYQDKTLDVIVKMPQAAEWLSYALTKWPENNPFGKLLWAIVRTERPELIKEEA